MMRQHHYFDWLKYQSDKIIADHPDSPDLAEKGGEIVIVPRESHNGQHELIAVKDSYWIEEDEEQNKVIAFNQRGHEVAVAYRS